MSKKWECDGCHVSKLIKEQDSESIFDRQVGPDGWITILPGEGSVYHACTWDCVAVVGARKVASVTPEQVNQGRK